MGRRTKNLLNSEQAIHWKTKQDRYGRGAYLRSENESGSLANSVFFLEADNLLSINS